MLRILIGYLIHIGKNEYLTPSIETKYKNLISMIINNYLPEAAFVALKSAVCFLNCMLLHLSFHNALCMRQVVVKYCMLVARKVG